MRNSFFRQKKRPQTAEKQNGEIQTAFCLNCETMLFGNFCRECGQRADTKPFTLKSLLSGLRKFFTKFDSEITRTFFALLIRPSEFCRNYLDGKRIGFTDPIKFFFIAFVFDVTIFGLIRRAADNPAIREAAATDFDTQIFILATTFFWAVAYTLVFCRKNYNLAENTVCMLYLTAETRIFLVFLQLLFLPFALFYDNAKQIAAFFGIAVSFVYYILFS